MRFVNRLTHEICNTFDAPRLAGLILLQADEPLLVNNIELSPGSYLLPDSQDRLRVCPPSGSEVVIEDYLFEQFPDPTEQRSLFRFYEDHLQKASWAEWSIVSPLVQTVFPKDTQIQPFDHQMGELLWHVEEVSRRPLSHLALDIERMPVARARRAATQAYAYLASHTEDWQHRQLTQVVPRRVLSMIPVDLFDFYENRLTARLTECLFQYINERHRKLRQLRQHETELSLGTPRRQQRVFKLLADAVEGDAQESHERVKTTFEVVRNLRRRLIALFSQPLYSSISAQSRSLVPPVARITNILANDKHYRFVNDLWHAYLTFYEKPKTPEQIQRERQDLAWAFEHYAMLLIVHSLDQLNIIAEENGELGRGKEVSLAHEPTKRVFTLRWTGYGTVELVDDQRILVRFVPIISSFTGGADINIVRRQLDQLASTKLNVYTAVLYPGVVDEREKLPLSLQHKANHVGNDVRFSRGPALIPCSTYELDTVERVARCVRWALWSSLILSYPPRVKVPGPFRQRILASAGWLEACEDLREIAVLSESEDQAKFIEALNDLRQDQKRHTDQAQFDSERLEQFKDALDTSYEILKSLRTCPVCEQLAPFRNFSISQNHNFYCSCPNCESSWGTRECGQCHARYPFLQSGVIPDSASALGADWVNKHFGMDVLAVPCPRTKDYVCPECGYCRQLAGDPICAHCLGG